MRSVFNNNINAKRLLLLLFVGCIIVDGKEKVKKEGNYFVLSISFCIFAGDFALCPFSKDYHLCLLNSVVWKANME